MRIGVHIKVQILKKQFLKIESIVPAYTNSQTSRKRPPDKSSLAGHLREVRPKGV